MSSVTRRGAVWHACFRNAKGERVTKSTKLTDKRRAQALAEKWASASKGELTATEIQRAMSDVYKEATGTTVPTFTVRAYLNDWYERKVPKVSASSGDKYRYLIAEFLAFLGERADQPLRQIGEADLESFIIECNKRTRPKTTNGKLVMLGSAFKDAWVDGYLPDDICKRIKKMKVRTQDSLEKHPFTQEQVDAIIQNAEGEWIGITTLGAYTGQRLGDIVNLRWRDVGTAFVTFTAKKTQRPMRVPLHTKAAEWFAANRGQYTPEKYIFPLSHATFVKNRNKVSALSKQFGALLGRLGIAAKREYRVQGKGRRTKRAFSPLSFHSYRHFLTSELHRLGVVSPDNSKRHW